MNDRYGASPIPKKLRICLLSYRSNPHCGGQGVYIKHLSRGLKDLGHHVSVISGPPDPELDEDIPVQRLFGLDLYNPKNPFRLPSPAELIHPINLIEWLGVSTMGFPEPFTFGLRAYQYLRRHRDRFDIIHDNQSLSYGIWAIGQLFPIIATIHHPITIDRDVAIRTATCLKEKLRQLRWYSFIAMQRRIARQLPGIITVSKRAGEDITRHFGVQKNQIKIIPNGIDTQRFHPLPNVAREMNRIIVTNSADMPLKGLKTLLNAVAEVGKKRPIRLVVVGSPNKNGATLKRIKKLGIGPWVTFTGRIDQDEFVKQYAKAAIAVVPSVYEGFGLPAGEAMACGVPVISTNGGALPEVVGDAGILIPPENPAALAQAITGLFLNPEKIRQLGEMGYRRVHSYFSWEKAAEKTIQAYRHCIERKRCSG